MGTSYNVYIGPAFKVSSTVFNLTETQSRQTCLQEACGDFRAKYLKGEFCSKCGVRYETYSYESKLAPHQALFRFGEMIGQEDVFNVINSNDDSPKNWFFNSCLSKIRTIDFEPKHHNGTTYDLQTESIERAVTDFKNANVVLYDWLLTAVPAEEIHCGFYVVPYTS